MQPVKVYKIKMLYNFLNTRACCGHCILKATTEASWPLALTAAFTRNEGGNPYLAASSDFIPRNSAPVNPIG